MNIYKYVNYYTSISIDIIKNRSKTQPFSKPSTLIKYLTQTRLKITSLAPHKANWQKGFIKLSKHALINTLIITTVLFGTGIAFLFNPFGTSTADAAWFNDNWSYRKTMPITAHTADETDRYISITIADTDDLVTASQLQSAASQYCIPGDSATCTGPIGEWLFNEKVDLPPTTPQAMVSPEP